MESFLGESEQKTYGFNLMCNKYKPVIYPLISELVTWRNWKNSLYKIKHTVLNIHATVGDKLHYNDICNNKVVTI